MFSMNQARYSTVVFLRGLCKFAILTTATTCQFSMKNFKNPATNVHHFTLKKKVYTYTGSLQKNNSPELGVYAKETHTAEVDYDIHVK